MRHDNRDGSTDQLTFHKVQHRLVKRVSFLVDFSLAPLGEFGFNPWLSVQLEKSE